MKTKTTVSEITHDELVNLFSTSCEGSSYLDIQPSSLEIYEKYRKQGDCHEDILARILLDGGHIVVMDYYCDEEYELYGNLPKSYDEEDGCGKYELRLDDIVKGLQNAFDDSNYSKFARDLADEECDFDLDEADTLMQIIVFGEVVYG